MQTLEMVVGYFLMILGMIAVIAAMLCGFILWMTKHYSKLWPNDGEDPVGDLPKPDSHGRRTTYR